MMLDQQQTDSLKRLLDFVVGFHGDDLPENDPDVTQDVVGLLEAFREHDFAFAEGLLNQIEAPSAAESELPL
jgi:hypothetical protein